jgi:signal transduction histidine kinase
VAGAPDRPAAHAPPPGALAELADRRFERFADAAEAVVAGARQLLDMELLLVTEVVDGRYVILAISSALPDLPLGIGDSLPWPHSLCYQHLYHGAPPVAPELRDEPRYWEAWLRLRPALGVAWDVRSFVTVPIRLDDGALFGTLCAHHTAPLDVGEPAREALAVLARVVGEQLGRERARAALEDAHAALVEAEARRSELVTHVAAALRVPLASIDDAVERLAALAWLDPVAVQGVRDEARRVQRVVEELDQLVRLDDPSAPQPELAPVALDELAREVVERFEPLAEAQEVTLEARGDAIEVDGERDRLAAALGHLVQRALAASAPGGRVAIEHVRDDGHAVLRVGDEAEGLGEPGGPRLGLALVRQVAARHGGEAVLTSTPGAGTRVELRLPLATDAGPRERAMTPGAGYAAIAEARFATEGDAVAAVAELARSLLGVDVIVAGETLELATPPSDGSPPSPDVADGLPLLTRLLAFELRRERDRARLADAHAAVVEAVRRRTELVSDVAHELRAPLMVIDGYLEGVLDGVFPADAETFGLIRAEARRVRALVDDLEHLVQLEASSEAADGEADLARLAVDAVRRFAPLAAQRQVALALRTSPAPSVGDVSRLERAVANLVRNALAATSAGGTVELRTDRSAGLAALSVVDDGHGMTPEEVERAFERFFRGARARDRQDGSGLGLAIVREIVGAAGGGCEIESSPGEGTRVTITLPAR